MVAVRSLDPSSTTMTSFLSQVCPKAERIAYSIHSWALYAGIKMETNGFIERLNFRPAHYRT